MISESDDQSEGQKKNHWDASLSGIGRMMDDLPNGGNFIMKIDKLKKPVQVEKYALQIAAQLKKLRRRAIDLPNTFEAATYILHDPEIKWLEYLHTEVLKLPKYYVNNEDLVLMKLRYQG